MDGGEISKNHAISASNVLSVKGNGLNAEGASGSTDKVVDNYLGGFGLYFSGPAVKSAKQNFLGQNMVRELEKNLDKRPVIITQFSSSKEMVLNKVVRGDFSTMAQGDLNAGSFDNIKAHFNPAFESSRGFPVPIFDGALDSGKYSAISFKDASHKKEKNSSVIIFWGRLGDKISNSKERHGGKDSIGHSNRKVSNALRGRGSRFKASSNFRVPLAESMEEMAKFISNPNFSNDLNSDSDGMSLIMDGDIVSRQKKGCASDKFPRIFWEYNRDYSPDIISLLETRVSGSKADNIIAKLEFSFSHRVEAIGFSGGIWIGWKNSVAIGDFNAILSSFEKSGGMSKSRRCPFFGDFVDKVELHDLGYRGPPFTWHRGMLFERLDRALGNNAWVQNFPNSLVTYLPKIKFDHRPLLLSLNSENILPRARTFRVFGRLG
ncbi:hypothetical protein CXB51_001863 [Gossypium anomalum]|uniref:Endonuclease/exonuclease/phosphatase domain-containing protein n=1 Tax=Gossypium anomalum TaxID=47600 RepID=A0A8J6A2Q6_9ROSI|nr:hypothetical protein CXB51_001863 [Gossypium anomalum]